MGLAAEGERDQGVLTAEARTEDNRWVVTIAGDLDLYTVPALRSLLSRTLATVETAGATATSVGTVRGTSAEVAHSAAPPTALHATDGGSPQ